MRSILLRRIFPPSLTDSLTDSLTNSMIGQLTQTQVIGNQSVEKSDLGPLIIFFLYFQKRLGLIPKVLGPEVCIVGVLLDEPGGGCLGAAELAAHLPISQSINQSVNQSISQLVN